jgi:hypothetical protein
MSSDYAKTYDRMLRAAYGPFPPGSVARAQRDENSRKGLATCHCCLQAFNPNDTVKIWYCSLDCARGDDRRYARTHPGCRTCAK